MPELSTFITIAVLGIGIWNTYMHLSIKTVILELQLNIRREMNGKYVSIENAAAAASVLKAAEERLEDRVGRIEDKVYK